MGKEVVDIIVENSLLKRALGYEYIEETRERIVDSGQKKRHDSVQELTEKEWEIIKAYFNETCCYCGDNSSHLTKDHLKPLADSGMLVIENIVPCCGKCNSSKKDNEWLIWFRKQNFYDKRRAEKIVDYVNFALRLKAIPNNSEFDMVVTKQVVKHVLPDVTAQIFWLKNRKPEQWRDKREVEEVGNKAVDALADILQDLKSSKEES